MHYFGYVYTAMHVDDAEYWDETHQNATKENFIKILANSCTFFMRYIIQTAKRNKNPIQSHRQEKKNRTHI